MDIHGLPRTKSVKVRVCPCQSLTPGYFPAAPSGAVPYNFRTEDKETAMRKITLSSRIALLLLLMTGAAAAQDTKTEEGKKLWEKWIEARGGRERLAKITEFKWTTESKLVQRGLSVTTVTYKKGPGKYRLDQKVAGMTITSVLNGDTAWYINPQTGLATDMPKELKAQMAGPANEHEALLNPEQFGHLITFEGRESIGGKEYILLRQKSKEGTVVTHYIDPGTFLRYKSKVTAANVENDIVESDYREVEGIKVPFKQVQLQNGKESNITTVTDYKINCNLDDSLFVKP